jgi:hypothetical protein
MIEGEKRKGSGEGRRMVSVRERRGHGEDVLGK